MSVDKHPTACMDCGSANFDEIGRIEAGPDTQPHDVAIYQCSDCGYHFCTDDLPEPARCNCAGGHALLCPEHAEEAMTLMSNLAGWRTS